MDTNEIQQAILETLREAKDFTVREAPGVLREAVYYYQVEYCVLLVSALASTFAATKLTLWAIHRHKLRSEFGENYSHFVAYGVTGVAIGVVAFLLAAANLLQLWLAPRWYLVEKFIDAAQGK